MIFLYPSFTRARKKISGAVPLQLGYPICSQSLWVSICGKLLNFCLLVIVIFMAPGCRREKKQPLVLQHDQSQLVRSLEAKFFDLYIPFGIISRELLFESPDSSIVQLRYEVVADIQTLWLAYKAQMDGHGWVLKGDIDGNPKILFFKKPNATCFVYIQQEDKSLAVIISIQKKE